MSDEYFNTYGKPETTEVYNRETGRKQTVPTEWIDHPVLGGPFRKTPLSEKQQRDADKALAAAAEDAVQPESSTDI